MWEPGTLVECLRDDWEIEHHSPVAPPKIGGIYTVDDCVECDHGCIGLVEYASDIEFDAIAFRPLSESRLSIFRSLLTETPKTVNVGEEA